MLTALLAAPPAKASAGPEAATLAEKALRGTWHLQSWTATLADGTVTHPYGEDAVGHLTYDPTSAHGGNVWLILARQDRPPYADPANPTETERAAALAGFFAYFGTYEVELEEGAEDEQEGGEPTNPWRGTVTHKVETCSLPHWIGTEQVRHFRLEQEGGRLVLASPPVATGSTGGGEARHVLGWGRLRFLIPQ